MDDMNKTLESLNELAKQRQEVYDQAYQAYTNAVHSMTAVLVPDEQQVGELFDGLLTFCDDKRFTELYKKLCRHVIALYPKLVESYIQMYHFKYEATELVQEQRKQTVKETREEPRIFFLKRI